MPKKKNQLALDTYESAYARALSHHKDSVENISLPTYKFEVGEEVMVGNLHDCRVEALLFEGRLVHVSYHDKGTSYGKPFDNNRRLPWVGWWMEVEPKKLMGDTKFCVIPSYMRATFTNTSLGSMLNTTYSRGLIDSPVYQRDYVWTLEDKQHLIDSIFQSFDIGKFVFLTREPSEWRLEIVDGKQRLNAIRGFYEGRFPYKGKTYFELSRKDRHSFDDLNIQYCYLKSETFKQSDLLWLFLSLNQGGVPQTEAHIARVRTMYEKALLEEANDG